ncbi:Speckle-type POZ protein [Araneus ventricosus]|uniref:Speckle-type POZ protein n=1 Tax=Araneus ventricosus TaxID=182803 RepID=A0A4Y2H6L9_ARAVE|nr:Speckle-type POZ protein [Araneus ventricosus]
MNKRCMHQTIDGVDSECYLFTWSIPKASSINYLDTLESEKFEMRNKHYYFATLDGFRHTFSFSITTNACGVKCSVSMFLGSGTLLFSNTLKTPTKEDRSSPYLRYYDLMSLTCDSECYQKLKQHPNDSLILICRIILRVEDYYSDSVETLEYVSTNSLNYMKKLADALRNSSESLLKEKVSLRVGKESETVNKAILCARSPVFAKMFQSDMREAKENVVTITDIKMPVLKVLVSFLCTGILSNCDSDWASNWDFDFDFLCELYYAANKYDITELRHVCVDLLLPQISIENIFQVAKLAFTHVDERLKSTVKTLIAANIETLVSKNEWKDLINDEPQIAVEALTFFDI